MPDPFHTQLLAWQSTLPASSAFTGLTSARLRGWWLPPLPPHLPLFVALPTAEPRPRRTGLVVVRHPVAPPHEVVAGVCCATAAETVLACARDLRLLDLVTVAEAAVHTRSATVDALRKAARGRRRGAPLLRESIDWVDGRAESIYEVLLRVLHVVCGIAVEPQHELRDDGRLVARGDLWLVGTRMFHEYDGGDHLTRAQQRKDLRRLRRLGHREWDRRGYTREDVLFQPVGILRDADRTVGRAHDPARVRAWNALLRESLFTPAGRAAWSAASVYDRKVVTPPRPDTVDGVTD